jgi:hypothetical protein
MPAPVASPGQKCTRSTVRQRPARRQIPAAAARGACARRRYSPGPAGLSPVTSRLPPPGRAASPSSQNRPAPLHTKLQPFPADSPRSVSPGGPAPATPSAGADTGTCSIHYRQTCGCERRPPRSHAGQGSPTHPCRTPSGHVVVRAHRAAARPLPSDPSSSSSGRMVEMAGSHARNSPRKSRQVRNGCLPYITGGRVSGLAWRSRAAEWSCPGCIGRAAAAARIGPGPVVAA